ncbi:hypothetical protein [Emticicia sp. SJ17W-69]|uniref:hypothetical protein n=1 Tax=Emticicia sp. SJ17W-69 TaxID=3421657 RepID=UPI003EBE1241
MIEQIFINDLQHWIGLTTALLVICSQSIYLYSNYKANKKQIQEEVKLKPAFLSWIGWSILMGISFISQYINNGWSFKLVTLSVSAFGCMVIGICSRFIFKRYYYKPSHYYYVVGGLLCCLIYLFTNNVWITNIAAITADLILAVPVIKNAVLNPQQEKSIAWPITLITWLLNMMMVIVDFSWLHTLWPAYLILLNGALTILIYRNKEQTDNILSNEYNN